MSTPPKLIYKFNAFPIKMQIDNLILIFKCKCKERKVAQATLKKRTLSNIKSYSVL